ncbi:MAG: hypothetical protein ACE5HI_02295 [bacterium]
MRNYSGGPLIRPYDVTGWTLPLMMGVETIQINQPFEADLTYLKFVRYPPGYIVKKDRGNYVISHNTNRSFMAVNRLIGDGKKVYWLKGKIDLDGKTYQPGAVFVPFKEMKLKKMDFLAQELSIEVVQTEYNFQGEEAYRLKDFKLGLYQPWTANIDEGWTRFLLEMFEFPYKSIYNSDIKKGNLKGDFDVIILPDMASKQIIHGRKRDQPDIYTAQLPTPYQDGITEDGVKNLKEFVEKGGTLIALDSACDFAVEEFGLPAENVLKDKTVTDFFCPGSLLEIRVDNKEPVAYGMPATAAAMFVNSPVFRPFYWQNRTGVVACYPDHNPLLSGWISGEEKIQGLSAVLDIPFGKGRVVLISFRAQNRAQTYGTYKFLFNAIHLSQAEEVVIKK